MRRRDMLKGMAALIAARPDFPLRLAGAAAAAEPGRVRPGDAAWPSPADWARLNEAVGGNLIAAPAPFGACATDPQGAPCLDAVANLKNPFYLGEQPGGAQVSGWLDAWTPAPSAYAVKALGAGDVAAAVNFARDHNLRLVVKSAGHSYQGTSNAPDSLLIWTRAIDKVTLHDAFTPEGCEGRIAPCAAVSAEAGAVWIDLYHAVTTEAGRYVQGGGCADVGVAGIDSERRLRQLFQGVRHGGGGAARSRDRHRRRRGSHRQRRRQSGSVLGAQGRRRRKLGRGHASDAAHP
jgi:FAD binding domain-containing protein